MWKLGSAKKDTTFLPNESTLQWVSILLALIEPGVPILWYVHIGKLLSNDAIIAEADVLPYRHGSSRLWGIH